MTRWIAPPLLAAALFAGSGYLAALERSTAASLELAETSARAPASTEEAVVQLRPLPEVAELTERQAELAEALAEALRTSADRLNGVNATLERQTDDLGALRTAVGTLEPRMDCIRERTEGLLDAAREAPPALREIAAVLRRVVPWQDKAIRHLRSINRKLTALGVVAVAIGVEPPSPPPPAGTPSPGTEPPPVPC